MVFVKGMESWCKGLTKDTDERIKKIGERISLAKKGKTNPKCSETRKRLFKEGKIQTWNKGKKGTQISWCKGLTKETDERLKERGKKLSEIKIKLFKEGKLKVWNKGLTKEDDKRLKCVSEKCTKLKNSEEWIETIGKQARIKSSATRQDIDLENWKKFSSKEPYDQRWNDRFKRVIRQRDNYICMLCGIHREKLSDSLSIHHINYDRKLSIPQNCVSLCRKCHNTTQKDRTSWTKFFQSLLSERYDYQYNENQEIILEAEIKC